MENDGVPVLKQELHITDHGDLYFEETRSDRVVPNIVCAYEDKEKFKLVPEEVWRSKEGHQRAGVEVQQENSRDERVAPTIGPLVATSDRNVWLRRVEVRLREEIRERLELVELIRESARMNQELARMDRAIVEALVNMRVGDMEARMSVGGEEVPNKELEKSIEENKEAEDARLSEEEVEEIEGRSETGTAIQKEQRNVMIVEKDEPRSGGRDSGECEGKGEDTVGEEKDEPRSGGGDSRESERERNDTLEEEKKEPLLGGGESGESDWEGDDTVERSESEEWRPAEGDMNKATTRGNEDTDGRVSEWLGETMIARVARVKAMPPARYGDGAVTSGGNGVVIRGVMSISGREPRGLMEGVEVIGDSMVSGATALCERRGVKVSTYEGVTVRTLGSIIRAKGLCKTTEMLVLMAGTHDIRHVKRGQYRAQLRRETEILIRSAKEEAGGRLKVIVMGVMTRTDVLKWVLEEVNAGIEEACERDGALYVETGCWIGLHDLAQDGLHLSREGGTRLGELIIRMVEKAGKIR